MATGRCSYVIIQVLHGPRQGKARPGIIYIVILMCPKTHHPFTRQIFEAARCSRARGVQCFAKEGKHL